MIKIKSITRNKRTGREFKEEFEVTSLETAIEDIKAVVDDFNNTLRPGGSPREFVRLIESEPPKQLHQLDKINLVTQQDKRGYLYDDWACKLCGAYKRCYSIRSFERFSREECHPERTCKECGGVWNTVRGYQMHVRHGCSGRDPLH